MLPPPSTLEPDGLLFVAKPELRAQEFALVLRLRPGETAAEGLLSVDDAEPGRCETVTGYPVHLPASAFRALTRDMDAELDGFDGGTAVVLDDTSLSFERVRGHRVTSGGGNIIEPYRSLSEEVLRTLRHADPTLPLPPPGRDWYPGN